LIPYGVKADGMLEKIGGRKAQIATLVTPFAALSL